MALLQISEPGASPDPHQRRIGIGIDLGTTHSLVAAMRDSLPYCLPDAQGRVILPSAVHYAADDASAAADAPAAKGRLIIGHEALQRQAADPANTIVSVKRLMGRSLHDIASIQGEWLPYELAADQAEQGMVRVRTRAGDKSPVEISASLLSTLRQRAEASLGGAIDGAVITVPAYFDDAQRQATKDAAQLAGLPVLRLINEPTAAALAYGLDKASEGLYAVFDLGGGTFDISILRMEKGVFEVLATGGDSALGGDDYDRALADWVQQRSGQQPTQAEDRAAWLMAARACKHALTSSEQAVFSAPAGDQVVQLPISRSDFAQATQALTQRCLQAVRATLHDAHLPVADVQGVVMVGGSSRMPVVQNAMREFFGKPLLCDLNPDEVVALGAAIQADQLLGNAGAHDVLLLDVIPLSLGIETMGGLVERIIPRNQTIPVAMAQEFTTYQDGQTAMSLHVVQGERDLVQDCRSLARFTLRGIPPMAAGAARIRVTFTVDADGLLQVHASEQTSGVEAQIEVKPSYGLDDDTIARMLQESFASAGEDMAARALAEARVDAERLLLSVRSALAADGDLLQVAERQAINAQMEALQALLTQGDAAAIEAGSHALAHATEAFAAARMNRGIQQALTGKTLNDL
ncbi:MAG: Fe-S protein assembly chaperone HscA [Brachymonas sp.]|nr:Fe-S protein assembly chaperone HscA [Brachymonas sp.]